MHPPANFMILRYYGTLGSNDNSTNKAVKAPTADQDGARSFTARHPHGMRGPRKWKASRQEPPDSDMGPAREGDLRRVSWATRNVLPPARPTLKAAFRRWAM